MNNNYNNPNDGATLNPNDVHARASCHLMIEQWLLIARVDLRNTVVIPIWANHKYIKNKIMQTLIVINVNILS